MRFLHVQMLHFLWLLPLVVVIYVYAYHKRKTALALFAEAGLLPSLSASVSFVRRCWKIVFILLALVFTVIALSRPAWNQKPKTVHRQGRDLVFVLDVSKSMLAEDLKPNRLERAKLAIQDCVDQLEGDRVGPVVFAGTAVVKCPLTLDYGFFRDMLEDVSVDSVSRGGTLIGDAVRKALNDVFDDQLKEYKDCILITDGEDQDSFPVQAAEALGKQGVRIIAIGLGDENQGKRIPITDARGRRTFVKYKGQEVWTKLDADTLRKMANMTPDGKYLNVSTGTIDLGEVYQQFIASAAQRSLEAKTITLYEEKFQIFLGFAFFFLCLEFMISDRTKKQEVIS